MIRLHKNYTLALKHLVIRKKIILIYERTLSIKNIIVLTKFTQKNFKKLLSLKVTINYFHNNSDMVIFS